GAGERRAQLGEHELGPVLEHEADVKRTRRVTPGEQQVRPAAGVAVGVGPAEARALELEERPSRAPGGRGLRAQRVAEGGRVRGHRRFQPCARSGRQSPVGETRNSYTDGSRPRLCASRAALPGSRVRMTIRYSKKRPSPVIAAARSDAADATTR